MNRLKAIETHWRWTLAAILLVGLGLRLLWVTVWDANPELVGGDGPFYIGLAQALASGAGLSINGSAILTAGPVYPAYMALFYLLLPPEMALQASRMGEAFVGVGSIVLVFWLTTVTFERRAGLLAAAWMAIDLRFVTETGRVYTETVFVLMLLLALAVYVWALKQESRPAWMLTPALGMGVATLTRAIAVVLMPVFGLHLLLTRSLRPALVRIGWLVLPGVLVLTPWLIRNYSAQGVLTITEGAASHFWLGTVMGEWQGQEAFREAIATLPRPADDPGNNPPASVYITEALKFIVQHPDVYVGRLVNKLLGAYLQPSGTVPLGGPSVRQVAADWLAGEASLAEVAATENFWPKLWMYFGHFGSIGLAVAALWLRRTEWKAWLLFPLVIAAVSGGYLFLTMIPRYLFPIMPLYIILAGGALSRLIEPAGAAAPSPTSGDDTVSVA